MKSGTFIIFEDAMVIQWQADAASLEQIIERQGLDAFVSTLVFVLGEHAAVREARLKLFQEDVAVYSCDNALLKFASHVGLKRSELA